MPTYSWSVGTNGDWNTGTNWSGGAVPNATNADVVIDAPPSSPGPYTVTIAAGESITVSTLTLNPTNNQLGVLQNPQNSAVLEIGGTLTFAPGSAGTLDGPLQSSVVMNNGTIINGGTVNGFIQAVGSNLFAGTNGFYVTNWLQALGTVTVDTTSIAEMTGTTLFDGIFDAKGPSASVELGGTLGGLTVNIVKIEGPPLIPEGWTELLLTAPGSQILEWNGTKYVSIEQTLSTISARGTLDVLQQRDYTTTNTLTIENGGKFNLDAGVVTAGGMNIQSGGLVQGNATITSDIINNGTVLAGSGLLTLGGSVTGSGLISFEGATGTLEVNSVSAGETIDMSGTNVLQLNSLAGFAGTIVASLGDSIILKGVTATTATLNGSTLTVSNGTTTVGSLILSGSYTGDQFDVAEAGGNAQITVAAAVCYARGTRIMTTEGEVAVEHLTPGQLAVTASGATQPIVWVGRRKVNCVRHPRPEEVNPVRIRAGAFGSGLPKRDLVVSPQHAIFADGVLIPARVLVNDRNVTQESPAEVEYFHVELPRHDLLLAEGLAAESYLENGDRQTFENHHAPLHVGPIDLHPSFKAWTWDARACAELMITGPVVEAVQARLAERASRGARIAQGRRRAARQERHVAA